MTTMLRAASVCCLCMCLAGLVGTDGFDSGTLVLSQGGNNENDATLLVVMAVLELTLCCRFLHSLQRMLSDLRLLSPQPVCLSSNAC